jgi:hypothetical protein
MSDAKTNTPEREADPAPPKPKKPSWFDRGIDNENDYAEEGNPC